MIARVAQLNVSTRAANGNRREKNMDQRKFNALAFERTGVDDLSVVCEQNSAATGGHHAAPNREGK